MKKIDLLKEILGYEEFLYEEEKSKNTIEKYIRDIKKFTDYVKEDEEISKVLLIKYKEYIRGNYMISSANTMFVALNKYFKFLGADGFRIKLFRFQRNLFVDESKLLQRKEYIRLLDAAKEQKKNKLALIIQTICSTGIRVSELKYISIEGVKKGKVEVRLKGKSRIIFLPKKLITKLMKYSKQKGIKSGCIFKSRSGNSLDRSNIWRDMKNLSKGAGVDEKKIFPHNLRHLFATTYYKVEKDILRLADILGHSSVETTRIYTKISSAEYERGVSSLNLVWE